MCRSLFSRLNPHVSLSPLPISFQYSMFLTTAAPLRRGSTPLPVKHQLRREEAVSEDCDWIPGLDEPATLPITDTAVPRNESFGQSAAAQSSYHGHGGALRIVLLGQNGVGKSSLALSLAGQSDRSLSIDSETQACGKDRDAESVEFVLVCMCNRISTNKSDVDSDTCKYTEKSTPLN